MKSLTFLCVLTIAIFLFAKPNLFAQCHGGGSSQNSKESNTKTETTTTNSDELIFYACPMHPEIKSLNPTTCSKCGMNLEQKKASLVKTEQTKDSVFYTCSMHPEMKENKPGSCTKCGMELIKKSNKETTTNETKNKFSFKVAGNCRMCKTRIEKAAKSVNGVQSAEWDSETKIITVITENGNVEAKEVSDAIVAGGYDTAFKTAQDEAYNKLPGCCKYEREKK